MQYEGSVFQIQGSAQNERTPARKGEIGMHFGSVFCKSGVSVLGHGYGLQSYFSMFPGVWHGADNIPGLWVARNAT